MDESKFTVVFNAFTVADEKGSPVLLSDDGRDLADFLYERFVISFEDLDLPIPYELRPPAHTCAIRGPTSEERAARAQDLAERINADIIVYGVISDTVDDPQFSLEFSVSPQGFEEGEEIAGPYALGGPLPIDLPFVAADLMFIEHPPHVVRTDVLSLISIGLAYYSLDNFEQALEYFQQAEQDEHWPRTDGKEIVYLLLGNAKVRQLFQQPSQRLVSSANDDYQQALDIKPDYARAKLGLAEAIYLKALGDLEKPTLQTVNWALLEESAATYAEASVLGKAQGNDSIEPKAHWGLGRIYYLQGRRGDKDMLEQAKREFQWIIDEYEAGNTRIANRAGHARAWLGLMAREEDDIDGAIEHYSRAVELVTPFYQAFYSIRLGELHCRAGEVVLAIEAYEDAVDQARLYGFRESVEEYTDKLNELQSTGCP
jgi:tetratricopeptide (TPR) repeat protein